MKKPMTSVEFARRIGVSQSTVSRALNDSPLVPETKRRFILKKAAQMGFVLNSHARSLKTNRTGTIGILFQKHFKSMNENLMLAHIYDLIQRELVKYSYDVMTIYDFSDDDDGRALERIITNRKIDGLIIIRSELSEKDVALIRRHNFPCVSIFNIYSHNYDLPYCVTDNECGGYLAGRFLAGFSGYRLLALGIKEAKEDSAQRNRGFRRGARERGVTVPRENFVSCPISFLAAYEYIMGIMDSLRRTKTAIFAHNDVLALGALDALKNTGVAVPDQVQIVGMDDIPMAAWLHPTLSTVHADLESMVPTGCSMLRSLIEGETVADTQRTYKPRLVVRQTTMNWQE